ncbi:MAG: Gfo/Idh/MocA family oxidoreductase [Rouxiella aceris]|uniref:Gfo/Idh/MocA family protein n=1 Tax=Rouxiella aceris TaxID=2703884 RepID=UPI00284DE8A6|nr:Gfo/Idh/MocA family oxidoreductase [Rouxiella aceris]MDR3431086.1 Gfo/Idh/MocA family oxidoreductase [Rouxiella aceris]
MRKIRIGVVGLGGIAQKAYLPVLSQAKAWTLSGGFSPNQPRAQVICDSYRFPCFAQLDALANACEAVFVHSSTESHFAVVSQLLNAGVHVYVDKPLAANLEQAEQLLELAERRGKMLMVGFNRRFAPLYRQLKQSLSAPSSIRMDKHRSDSIGPQTVGFTLLDDYLHVVDTALWLANGEAKLISGQIDCNEQQQLVYAEHQFACGPARVTTAMHRRAGTQREVVQAVDMGAWYQVSEMRQWQQEQGGRLSELPVPGWQTTLAQRGFEGAINHFIDCVSNQTVPETSGEQAILAQRFIARLLAAE